MNKKSKMRKGNVKQNKNDLKPWLALLKMLRAYVTLGYLQMDIVKHEVYVTQPAIHALSKGSDPMEQIKNGSVITTAIRIRSYAAWLSGEGKAYQQANFAVHVVKPDEPHDLIYTLVFTQKLRFFKRRDTVNIIIYPKK